MLKNYAGKPNIFRQALIKERNEKIIKYLKRTGASYKKAGAKFGIGVTSVYNIVQEYKRELKDESSKLE